MIEQYISVGSTITDFDFSEAQGSPLQEVTEGIRAGHLMVNKEKTIPLFCGLWSTKETSQLGLRFRYLPYAAGAINYCESQGVDVISAYFSGCLMARYKRGGSWRVCHVSTGGVNDCKGVWEAIKTDPTVSDVTEFNPFNTAISLKTLGLITNNGRRYAIGCTPVARLGVGQMALQVTSIVGLDP